MGKCTVSFVLSRVLQVKMLLYIYIISETRTSSGDTFAGVWLAGGKGGLCFFCSLWPHIKAESINSSISPSASAPPCHPSPFHSVHLLKPQPTKGETQIAARYYSSSWTRVWLEVIKADTSFFFSQHSQCYTEEEQKKRHIFEWVGLIISMRQ